MSVRDGVLTVTFDCPERLNAITASTLRALLVACDRAEDADVSVVVLTGAGGAFSAGQDLHELDGQLGIGSEDEQRAQLAVFQQVSERILRHPKPFVAAIDGVAVGFGAEVALACDIRLASTAARIGFVEATRALFQTNGVMWLLPRIVGHGNAARMLLTGEIVDAAEAHRIGLVAAVHAAADLAAAVGVLTERLVSNAPLSTRLVKQTLRASWTEDLPQVMEREVDGMLACLASADLVEGTRAFLERRRPVYTGQ